MSYKFGAANSNDIVATANRTLCADGSVQFICGWWYPTTLTSGRGYWSAGNTIGSEVDSTTSELRVRTDNSTDGQWITTGAGIVVDKWHFIAWLNCTENTGTLTEWRVWVGTQDSEPVQITPTVSTAPSGNFNSASTRYLGNKGTSSTLAFLGDIGWGFWLVVDSQGMPNALNSATVGVIGPGEDDFVRERLVFPIWRGRPPLTTMIDHNGPGSWSALLMALDKTPAEAIQFSGNTLPPNPYPAVTVNGATYTDNEPPVRSTFLQNWILGQGDSRILRRI
jgi:hypothetical protein